MSQSALAEPVPAEPVLTPGPDATQDEIDAHWLKHIYQPNERQLTIRALAAGMFLGGIMSVSNLYIGMKVGWSMGMALTSTILAFSVFAGLRKLGVAKGEFTKLENNTVASSASAAGYFSSAGMVSAIPALYLTSSRTLTGWELALWITAISFVGVLMAVPMRRQMIDVDRLAFPSGIACATTIRSMHEHAKEALAKARSLMAGALAAALFEIPNSISKFGRVVNPITWAEKISPTATWAAYGFSLNTSLLMYGSGAIMGIRVGLSLLLGAIVSYGILGPWLAGHGIIVPGETTIFRSMTSWSVWPGVIMVLVASLLQFALKWRTVVAAFGSLGKMFGLHQKPSLMAPVEVPPSWFGWGMLAATAFVCICAKAFFGIPVWMGIAAVAIAFLLSIVACRAAGETDVAPIGPLGKITQFIYAGISPGNYSTNLMTASVTAGSAAHSSDLLTDLKTGYLLGGAPRRQFIAQFFGIVAGALFCVPAYLIVVQPEKIGTSDLPAPAAQQWAAVADLLARGVSYEDRGPGTAVATTVEAVQLTQRLAGTQVGDKLRILTGPNAGDYAIGMMDRAVIALDRPLALLVAPAKKDAHGVEEEADPYDVEVIGPDGTLRGKTQIHASALSKPGLKFIHAPDTAHAGDYVVSTIGGKDTFHKMSGLYGGVAMLDHPFVAGEAAADGSSAVFVKKMGLPPYALEVTAITVLFGILITLLELYGPRRLRPWLPSVTGIGIAWVINCSDSIAMAIGAIIAYVLAKAWPAIEERYNVSTSSGIIAGASIMALVITLFKDILGYVS